MAVTRVVLALGTAQTLAWGSTYYLPAILAVPMARDIGLSVPQVFLIFSSALMVSALLSPLAGGLIDRHGGRGVLAASSMIFAGGLAMLAWSTGPVLFVTGWLMIGVGMAFGLYDAGFATLARIYGHGARGPMTGITLMAGLASTVCWPLSALMEAEFGWRITCLAWAALHLIMGLPLNFFGIPNRSWSAEGMVRETIVPVRTAPPARHVVVLLAFVFAATWFVTSAMAAHLPQLLQIAGASPSAALWAAALLGPAQVAARLLEFGLLRRHHPMVSARLATLGHPLGAAALLVFGGPAALLFAVLHGAGNGILTIVKGTLPLALFGPAGYGLREGWVSAASRFVQAVAPYVFGLLIAAHGAAALVMSAALSLFALAVLLAIGTGPAQAAAPLAGDTDDPRSSGPR